MSRPADIPTTLLTVDCWETAIEHTVVPQIVHWQKEGPLGTPIWVVAPRQSLLEAVKYRLLQEGTVFQVVTLTPEALRQRLSDRFPTHQEGHPFFPASREDRALALNLALEGEEGPLAQAARLDPDFWLRRLDELAASGVSLSEVEDKWLRGLAERQVKFLESIKGLSPIQFDRLCLEKTQEQSLGAGAFRLIVFGFDGRDTALLPLLLRAVQLSCEAQACLPLDASDALWTGTWEHFFDKAAEPIEGDPSFGQPAFIEAEGADAVLSTMLSVLNEALGEGLEDKRVVVASEDAGLLREAAALLESCAIAYYDGAAAPAVAEGAHACFQGWCFYQREGTLSAALHFLRILERVGYVDAGVAAGCERRWEEALGLLQSESIAVSQVHFALKGIVDPLLNRWPLFPRHIKIDDFIEGLRSACAQWGQVLVSEPLGAWAASHDALALLASGFSTTYLLDYVEATVLPRGKIRGPYGAHAWARIWLLPLEAAVGIPADNRLLLSSGKGPRYMPHCYGPLFNRLNQQATTQGCQGEGHEVLRSGRAWVLNEHEKTKRLEQLRQAFIMGPASATWLIGTRENQALLSECNFAELPKPLAVRPLEPKRGLVRPSFNSVRTAYEARRDAKRPFGPYEYAFEHPLSGGLSLSCGAWEEALERPVRIWYQEVLGIRPLLDVVRETGLVRQKGMWAHDWVQLDSTGPRPGWKHWSASVESKAEAVRAQVGKVFREAGQPIAPLWMPLWKEARLVALEFVERMAGATPFPHLRQEVSLPANFQVRLPTGMALALRGRMDAVLSVDAWSPHEKIPTNNPLWVVDLKTSHRRKLTAYNMQKGYGLQLALYALALQALGADNVGLSILGTASEPLVMPQIDLPALQGLEGLWRAVERVSSLGILGDKGESDFSALYGTYPLATLRVDKRILDQKWAITHPELDVAPQS